MDEKTISLLSQDQERLEQALLEHLPLAQHPGTEVLNAALRNALFPGGKRMRPRFLLLTCLCLGGDAAEALTIACAIEYLHASTLILDDLPAMDDAETRRGRPAVHRLHGQGVAILAALALLNQAYRLFAQSAASRQLIPMLCDCIGPDGLIGGQAVDLTLGPGFARDARSGYYLKTTALTSLMLASGGVLAGASADQVAALGRFGEEFGRAYQMIDDMMDEPADVDTHDMLGAARRVMEQAQAGLARTFPDGRLKPLMKFLEGVLEDFLREASGSAS